MDKCKKCRESNAPYFHNDGDNVCNNCVGGYFNCPDCGIVFDQDDFKNGDQGTGFCKACSSEH